MSSNDQPLYCLCPKHQKHFLANAEAPVQPATVQLDEQLVISVGEARKILGADAKGISDDELAEFIIAATFISQDTLKQQFLKNNGVTG